MARPGYPVSCLSMYCGRICCEGCRYRPVLKEFYESIGEGAAFEERDARSLALIKLQEERDCSYVEAAVAYDRGERPCA